jgi:hypothetical protein
MTPIGFGGWQLKFTVPKVGNDGKIILYADWELRI